MQENLTAWLANRATGERTAAVDSEYSKQLSPAIVTKCSSVHTSL